MPLVSNNANESFDYILTYVNINVAFSAWKHKPFFFLVRPTYHLYQSKSGQGKKLRKGKVFLRLKETKG